MNSGSQPDPNLADSIRSILNNEGAGAARPDTGAQSSDGAPRESRDQQSLRVAPRTAAAAQGPAYRPTETGSVDGSTEEFTYQERRHTNDVNLLAAEIDALSTSIDLDEARMRELQMTIEKKVAARQRLIHLHTAGTRYLDDLRSFTGK
jgi:hypothetical protein